MTTVTFPAPDRGSLASVVGANVRALMAARRVSQMQMAAILGVTQSAVSKRLRGVTPFDTNDLQAIADAFGVHAMELLNERFSPVSDGPGFVTLGYRRRHREYLRTLIGSRRPNDRAVPLALAG